MFSRLGAGIAILTLSAGPILVAAQYDIPALPRYVVVLGLNTSAEHGALIAYPCQTHAQTL